MESRISGHTKLFCLIGSPVGHSGSPAMYNYSFQRTGIDAAYLAFNIPLEDSDALAQAVKRCDILVNATRVGMKPLDGETLIDPALFRADLLVADTVYNPRETRMIQEAKAAGCKAAVGGIGMLLWQGVAAFKLFTGKDMPAQEVLEKFFS